MIFFFFLDDLYRGEEGEELPEWVKNEQEQFNLHRDKDRDGFLDTEEVITILLLIFNSNIKVMYLIIFR